MYTKHHTRGIVLAKHDNGEADRVYSLLTPDLGKVYAHANGVRHHHARHKGTLQTLSEASVSLVRGKTGWRITNASPVRSLYTELSKEKAKLMTLVRVIRLVRRMLAGEGFANDVFASVDALANALVDCDLSSKELKSIELLTVVRILHALGYIKSDATLEPFFADRSDVSAETLAAFAPHERAVLSQVNDALSASQL